MFALKGPVVTVKTLPIWFLSAWPQKPANIVHTLLHIQTSMCSLTRSAMVFLHKLTYLKTLCRAGAHLLTHLTRALLQKCTLRKWLWRSGNFCSHNKARCHFCQARNQEGRRGGGALSRKNFASLEKCVGHSIKNMDPSQKTLQPTWCPKLITGLTAAQGSGVGFVCSTLEVQLDHFLHHTP